MEVLMADKKTIDDFEECMNYGYDSSYGSKEEAIPLKCWCRGIERPPLSQLNIPKFVFEHRKKEMKMDYMEVNRACRILDFGIHEDKWSNLNEKKETLVSMTEEETNCPSSNYSEMCREEEKDYIPIKEVFSSNSSARNSVERNLNFTCFANTDKFILPGVYDGNNEIVITDEISTSNSEVYSNSSLNNLSEDCDKTKYETQNNNVTFDSVDFIKHDSCKITTSVMHKEEELAVNSNVDACSKDDSVDSLKKVNMKDTSSHNFVNNHLTCSSHKNINKFILPGVNEVDGEQDNEELFDEVLTSGSDKYSNPSSGDCIGSADGNSDYDSEKLGIEADGNLPINYSSLTNSCKSMSSQEEEGKLLFINNMHVHNIEKTLSYNPLRSRTKILLFEIHERSSEPNLTALNVGKKNKGLNSGNKAFSYPNLSDQRKTKYMNNYVKCKVRVPNICATNIKQPKSESLHTVKALKYQDIIDNKFSSIPYRENEYYLGDQTFAPRLEVLESEAVLKNEASYDKPTCESQNLVEAEKSALENGKKRDSWEELNTPFSALEYFRKKSGVGINCSSRESDIGEINVLDNDGSSQDYSGRDLHDCVEGSAGDLSAMCFDSFVMENGSPVPVDFPKEFSYLPNKEPQDNILGSIKELPKSVLNMKSIIQMVFAGVNKKSVSDTEEVVPQIISKGNTENILVIENLPEHIAGNDLKFILQQYGEVQNLSLTLYEDQQIAKVQINGNLEWMVDCLNGSQPFGEEFKPIKCYKSH